MRTIKLIELLDGNPYPDAGIKLYQIIVGACTEDEGLEIDMAGVVSLPTIFLNTSFGELIKNNGSSYIKNITFLNISKQQIERIQKYVRDVKELNQEV